MKTHYKNTFDDYRQKNLNFCRSFTSGNVCNACQVYDIEFNRVYASLAIVLPNIALRIAVCFEAII